MELEGSFKKRKREGGKELGWCRRVISVVLGAGSVRHFRTQGRRSDGTFVPG